MSESAIAGFEMPKVGIYGGTFDPIHSAHLNCAEQALNALELDKVIFIPANISPFKRDKKMADIWQRIEMCKLATSDLDKFEVSDIEAQKAGISYTIDTVRDLLSGDLKGSKLYYIIGSDAFLSLPEWKNSRELAELVDFIVIMREDDSKCEVSHVADLIGATLHLIDDIRVDISSSNVRDYLHDGMNPSGLLPESVMAYIQEKGLYRD